MELINFTLELLICVQGLYDYNSYSKSYINFIKEFILTFSALRCELKKNYLRKVTMRRVTRYIKLEIRGF